MAALLKDIFDKKLVKKLASEIKVIYSEFDEKGFLNNIFNNDWNKK